MRIVELIKVYRKVIVTCIIFTVIYSLISFVNHYNFRTHALDLGAYTNALYDYSHLKWNDSGVFKEVEDNLLADHFDLYLVAFSPLLFLFGTYTLLVVQIAAIISGGIGVYKYFYSKKENQDQAIYGLIYFFAFFGVFNALAFDYHSNVVAAALIPWLFLYCSKRSFRAASVVILLLILGKENISLWLAFVLLGLAIEYRRDILLRNYLVVAALFSLGCFVLITSYIMPAISVHGLYPHFHYSYLGSNIKEALLHLISHPIESMKVLFINHNNSAHGDFVKLETHGILVLSGLLFLFKKPHYLLMLVPIYFQKFFHDNYSMWGIGSQYNIEFAPVLSIGIYKVISELKGIRIRRVLNYLALVLVFSATLRTMDRTIFFTDKSRIRIYKKSHYYREYNVRQVHETLALIPEEAKVSAQSPFVPHLALRDDVYMFPLINDAEYIVYSEFEDPYPLSQQEFDEEVNKLITSVNWNILFKGDIIVLKKINP